ncbi:hypothetical protein D3C80_1503450 [compost metagenome]
MVVAQDVKDVAKIDINRDTVTRCYTCTDFTDTAFRKLTDTRLEIADGAGDGCHFRHDIVGAAGMKLRAGYNAGIGCRDVA